jgi:hypothetical protein
MQNPLAFKSGSFNSNASTGSSARLGKDIGEYATRLNLYRQPPPTEISIEQFETFALDRLQSMNASFKPSRN